MSSETAALGKHLTEADVLKVAKLARLELEPEEVGRMAIELSAIVGYVQKLSELDGQLKKITWEGNDRQAYLANKKKWDDAIVDMNQILAQISGAVTTAREGYGAREAARGELSPGQQSRGQPRRGGIGRKPVTEDSVRMSPPHTREPGSPARTPGRN